MIAANQALLGRLRAASSGEWRQPSAALDVLTGPRLAPKLPTQPQALEPIPTPRAPRRHGKRRTIYLDDEAERDLLVLLSHFSQEGVGSMTRSEGVRRALHSARQTVRIF